MASFKTITRRGALLGLVCTAGLATTRIAHSVSPHSSASWLNLPPTPELPKSSREGLLNLNGSPVFVAQFGKGPHVLLLHGGLGSSNYWGHQIEELSRDFQVTVMDTRGHGRSPVVSKQFSYKLFAKDVVELLAQLEITKTAVVGWSDGAIVGIELALSAPHLLSALFAFGANTNLQGLKAGGARTPNFLQYTSRCRAEYQKLSSTPEKWSTLQSGLGAMWKTEPSYTSHQLSKIQIPVVIADGQYDEIIKLDHTREIARIIPNSQLSIMAETSHFAMLQDPDQFNATLMQFLFDNL